MLISTWIHKPKIKLIQKYKYYHQNHPGNELRESLKRVLSQEFINKITDEAIKCMEISAIPEFKNKRNKMGFEAHQIILERIGKAMNTTEGVNVDRCQEKLQKSKTFTDGNS